MKDLSKFLRKSLLRGTLITTLALGLNYFDYKNTQSSLATSPEMSIDEHEKGTRQMPKQFSELLTEFTGDNQYVNYALEKAIYFPLKGMEFVSRAGRSIAYQELTAKTQKPKMVSNFKPNKFESYVHNQKEKMTNYFARNSINKK